MNPKRQNTENKSPQGIIGEVIRGSTSQFETQCYELYKMPRLGALVVSDDEYPIFGVVSHSVTESLDPTRTPRPRGPGAKNVKSIYQENPQLQNLLASKFISIIVGYIENDAILRKLSPVPPRILSLTRICTESEISEFSSNFDFIARLLNSTIGSPDDVLASFLNIAAQLRPNPEQYFVDAGKEVATLLPGQMRRVNLILRNSSI